MKPFCFQRNQDKNAKKQLALLLIYYYSYISFGNPICIKINLAARIFDIPLTSSYENVIWSHVISASIL